MCWQGMHIVMIMEGSWIYNLFFGSGVAHSLLIIAIVVAMGVFLGHFKLKGLTLGTTWVLFVGIVMSHFGLRADPGVLSFVKDFGLILFVYAIGLSVGPNFFSSFKKGGLSLNMWALMIVFLACLCTYIIHEVTGTPLLTMVGVMQGAVTNTPGLGAAQQTVTDMLSASSVDDVAASVVSSASASVVSSASASVASADVATAAADLVGDLSLGYAVAYPLGVVGIILSILVLKMIFRVNVNTETQKLDSRDSAKIAQPRVLTLEVISGSLADGKSVLDLHNSCGFNFVLSRIRRKDMTVEIPTSKTVLVAGDRVRAVISGNDLPKAVPAFGKEIKNMGEQDWSVLDKHLIAKRIYVTKRSVDGRTLESLAIRRDYGVSVTRLLRTGIEIVPTPNTIIFVGDILVAVGSHEDVEKVASLLGNSQKKLYAPRIAPIFFGIALGILLGSLPIYIPGMPQTVKLGLAGGPLIVAILLSYFGHRVGFETYTTQSANLMVREMGLCLFLAAVGLGAGENFVETLQGGGYRYVLYGFLITVLPLLAVGVLARVFSKTNYLTLMGLIAGSTTDPPALAFASETSGNSYPALGYATVYPLSMFLRVVAAQILTLIALS